MAWRALALAAGLTIALVVPGIVFAVEDVVLRPDARLVPWAGYIGMASAVVAAASSLLAWPWLRQRGVPRASVGVYLVAAILLAGATGVTELFLNVEDQLLWHAGRTYVFKGRVIGFTSTYEGRFVLHRKPSSLPILDH